MKTDTAAADECDVSDRMVRRSKRTRDGDARRTAERRGVTINLGDVEQLADRHRRQDRLGGPVKIPHRIWQLRFGGKRVVPWSLRLRDDLF